MNIEKRLFEIIGEKRDMFILLDQEMIKSLLI